MRFWQLRIGTVEIQKRLDNGKKHMMQKCNTDNLNIKKSDAYEKCEVMMDKQIIPIEELIRD